MDFAYVPGTNDPYVTNARRVMHVRVPADGLVPTSEGNLRSILEWVDENVPQSGSIDTVFLVSHAWAEGVSFPFTAGQQGRSEYETLVDIQPSPSPLSSSPFKTPYSFERKPASGAKRIGIVIKGCRIGRSKAFMLQLKSLLGGEVTVTAPMHYAICTLLNDDAQTVLFDALSYDVALNRSQRIEKHADLVAAFRGLTFQRYDGTQLPADELAAYVDQMAGKGGRVLRAKDYLGEAALDRHVKIPLDAGIKFKEAVTGKKDFKQKWAEYRAERVVHDLTDLNNEEIKTPLDELITAAKKRWDNGYGKKFTFPGGVEAQFTFAERLGLSAGEDIQTNISWRIRRFSPDFSKLEAIMYRYRLLVPITSVRDGTFLFASVAEKGSGLADPTTWPTDPAQANNLFRTV